MITTTAGHAGLACGSNRSSGRKQELFLKKVSKGGIVKERQASEKS